MSDHADALRTKSNREILLQLCGTLEHTLRFSSINRKWPEQKRSIQELIAEGRRRGQQKAPTHTTGK